MSEESPMADSPAVLAEPIEVADSGPSDVVVVDDVLVEEVSIDGMCGVY
jgi:mycofactocin precursor